MVVARVATVSNGVTVTVEMQSMSIQWTGRSSEYAFTGNWLAKIGSGTSEAGGNFSFRLQHGSRRKPQHLTLEGIVNEDLPPEKRQAVALAVKAKLRENARACIDMAWREMQTQLTQPWG